MEVNVNTNYEMQFEDKHKAKLKYVTYCLTIKKGKKGKDEIVSVKSSVLK